MAYLQHEVLEADLARHYRPRLLGYMGKRVLGSLKLFEEMEENASRLQDEISQQFPIQYNQNVKTGAAAAYFTDANALTVSWWQREGDKSNSSVMVLTSNGRLSQEGKVEKVGPLSNPITIYERKGQGCVSVPSNLTDTLRVRDRLLQLWETIPLYAAADRAARDQSVTDFTSFSKFVALFQPEQAQKIAETWRPMTSEV